METRCSRSSRSHGGHRRILLATPLPVASNRTPVHTGFATLTVSFAGKAPGSQRWGKATETRSSGAHTRGSKCQDPPQPSLVPSCLSFFPPRPPTPIGFSTAQALEPGNLGSSHKRELPFLPRKDFDWPAWVTRLSCGPIAFAKSGSHVLSALAYRRKQNQRQLQCR